MLRKKLEAITGPMTRAEFRELAEAVTDDIKANRIKYSKLTTISDIADIARIYLQARRRIRNSHSDIVSIGLAESLHKLTGMTHVCADGVIDHTWNEGREEACI